MTFTLLLGFFIGMTHALEADHLAAVASFSVRKRSLKDTLKQAYSWGMGHTVTLFLVVVPVFLFGGNISHTTEAALEGIVGLMLCYLGGSLMYRLRKEKVHMHVHSHEDGERHAHFHSHKDDAVEHSHSDHNHAHKAGVSPRALGIGLMHGLAGSAALLIYAQEVVDQKWAIVPYVLCFGIGSIAGMMLISKAISFPLHAVKERSSISFNGIRAVVGIATVVLGLKFAGSSLTALLG